MRQELGPADLLVANSGVGQPTPLEPMDTPIVENMFKVNLFGVIYAIEGVLPEMLERGTGHLVALPAYENDVLSALARTGGLPGLDAVNEVVIEREPRFARILPERLVT